jgi:membrane fusion protein, multidrug efflux system
MDSSNHNDYSSNGHGATKLDSSVKNGKSSRVEVLDPPVTIAPPLETAEQSPSIPPVPTPPKKSSAKKFLLLGALGMGAIAASVFGYRWWQFASTHEETDNATVAGHVYQISSRIPGTIQTLPVDDNQTVKKGQPLVKLDPQDYQVKVLQAQAALVAAQRQAEAAQVTITQSGASAQAQTTEAQGNVSGAIASISAAEAAVTEAQSGVPAAQAELAQANANLGKLQADYNRYQSLFSSGAIAKQQLDSAKAAYDVALAERSAAQQGVNQAQAKLSQVQQGVTSAQAQLEASQGGLQKAQASGVQTDVDRSQYAAANAAIAQAQAKLSEAQLQLSYTNITAPAAGRIGRKTAEVGEQVQAGTPLMAVVGNDLWVTANFKETQLNRMHPGSIVEVKLDAFPNHLFTGKVNSLSPASGAEFALLPPDNATGNFTKIVQRIPVKVVLNADSVKGYENQITPGMSASVTVEVE